MKPQKFVCHLLLMACAIATVSCVDDSFDLDNISTDVTIGSGTTVLPIGTLENKTIGDLLGGQDIDGLGKDENGNLSFNFSGEGDSIDIDGITTEFEIPEIRNSFDVEYPEFSLYMQPIEIDAMGDVYVDLSVLEGIQQLPDLGGFGYELPEGVELPVINGSYSKTFTEEEFESMHIDIALPDQIDDLSKILFKDLDDKHHGAPLHLRVDFNDLTGINGGGKLGFDLKINGGRFNILDADNNEIYFGSHYTDEYIVEDGAEYIDFSIYIESLTNDTALDENHHLNIPLELTFDMNFELQTKAGSFDVESLPHIELDAAFAFGDAEVAVNSDSYLVEYHPEEAQPIDIEGLPEQIKSVNRVTLTDGAVLSMFAHGLEWMGDIAEQTEILVVLPEYLKLYNLDGMNCEYNEETRTLKATVRDLDEGLQIGIEALDFGAEGIIPDENGNINIEFGPDIVAYFTEDASIWVSDLQHEGDLNISIGIEQCMLTIESVSGCVDYEYTVDQKFALEGLGDLNLEIAGVGLKPIIEVSVSNPLTIEAELSGAITPITDGAEVAENRVDIPAVKVAPATYANGEIIPTDITLIIADESLRENYNDEKYTFVACDVTRLLLGKLPEELSIDLTLGVDPNKVHTIYMAESLSVQYDYKIDIPFAIDNTFEIYYKDEVSGLNSTFKKIADYDFKVGDVKVIATVTNTTPLEFAPKVTMLDKDGRETVAQVIIDESEKILGSSDGETPVESVLNLVLDLGEDGLVSNVAAVDGLRVELAASSAANETSVPLKEEQYLGVKLQLQLDGGITVDLGDYLE